MKINFDIKKNLLSSLGFGVCFGLLTYVFDRANFDLVTTLVAPLVYFILMCLVYQFSPKLRKWTGHDK